jgi:hypothetical protein
MPKPNTPFRKVQDAKARMSPFERWQENRKERSIDWTQVRPVGILVAMAASSQAGATLVFGPAMGGAGVCLRVWHGDDKWTEYASTAEALNQLLEMVIDHYQSSSEDIYQALGLENPFLTVSE